MSDLVEVAKKILLENRRAGYTLPTNNKLYPAQWNWDSAFISLGYSYFNLDYAIQELETLLKGQWDDGMVPHILFHEVDDSYFPNHTTWSCGKEIPSSGITQPPIAASILRIIVKNNSLDETQNKKVFNLVCKLKKYHEWFFKNRDQNQSGLISIIHPWESGYDNSSLWDFALSKINVDKNLSYERRDLKVSNNDERPLNKDYDCYITLLNQFKSDNYNPNKLLNNSMFNIIDIGFNSIFLKANKDLIELLKLFKLDYLDLEEKIKKTENKIFDLYNEKEKMFFSFDLKNNAEIKIPSLTNFFILFADLNHDDVNTKIIKNLEDFNVNEKYFFTTIKPDHHSFEEKRYWRGPVWINTNWIIYKSLINKNRNFAEKVKKQTIKLINQNNFHEYYSSKTGLPFGANNFSWSAALYLDLMLSKN